MEVKFLCPRWGFEHIDWHDFLVQVKSADYAGIEWFPQGGAAELEHVVPMLKTHGLDYAIVMEVAQANQRDGLYIDLLAHDLRNLLLASKDLKKPLFLSAQVGREFFIAEQIDACVAICQQIQEASGIAVYHETHRNKWNYAAHVTAPVLQRHQQLELTLDISHWYCVSESYLHDQAAAVTLAIERTRHIHARVGHTEGPQVADPAFDEYQEALQAHLRVWDQWIAHMKSLHKNYCTITPEFGPPPYLTLAGRQLDPMAEQWRLNLWMKNLLQNRYNHE